MRDEIKLFLPLSPAELHILLALAGEDLHGYGIMIEVARQSGGQYKLGPGTLYDNLRKLLTQGCVEEMQKRARSEEHTSELQSLTNLVCRLLLEKKKEAYKIEHRATNSQTKNHTASTDHPT